MVVFDNKLQVIVLTTIAARLRLGGAVASKPVRSATSLGSGANRRACHLPKSRFEKSQFWRRDARGQGKRASQQATKPSQRQRSLLLRQHPHSPRAFIEGRTFAPVPPQLDMRPQAPLQQAMA